MRALVFADFGRVELADIPDPDIQEPTDCVIRVTKAAICGSDLHVLNGRIPGMYEGAVLGHEFIGVVEKVGSGVTRWSEGDRVLASFIIPCGTCWYCERRMYNRCPDCRVFGYGAFLGDINGGQAERVRIPNADICLHTVPAAMSDETALFAGDIFTTGFYCASEARIEPGDVVVVQGCGPVGLMAIQAAKTFSPGTIYAVDTISDRLEMAQTFGAIPVDAGAVHVPSFVQDHTDGRGADVLLECVGAIPALIGSVDVVRPGGRICVIGVYSEPEVELPLNMTFMKGLDIKFCGTANVVGCWDQTLDLIGDGVADPAAIITHRLPLDQAVTGYELFASRQALKVVLTP